MIWLPVNKGDLRARALADKHYTRKRPGHPQWTRPGYNYVLVTACGLAAFVWWRPKWEAGAERYDGLRCIECTLFRRTPKAALPIASEMVRAAVAALELPEAWDYLRGELSSPADLPSLLVTGVSSEKTRRGRSKDAPPGRCFIEAGWTDLDHKKGRADVWLQFDRAMAQEAAE